MIAHNVTVMVLQAAAGGRVARDPVRAAETFEVIEHAGRDALADMRRVVGVLKDESDDGPVLSPQPSLAQLEALVTQVRHAGVNVRVNIDGDQRPLAPGVELSAYRIVQESLTNVLRHSGASDAEVALHYAGNALTVEVTDNGQASAAQHEGGNGLTGMRERVALLNGDFAAGETAPGFIVSARLPLEASTA